ncbi:pentapeptide repeat-containing protein [Iningainema tapete]|uniref:Pentapeptide repeat-containing protein n=1 Tax=Iningainema tapete BLCC-T55 TaxID=2748662 RepID=A0A8J7BY15_9CYAN|nr:pentapeptide repeat-containing protein [Iningainema tapete]MBD2774827.1 pentapeptide repeat-containing protein [Iningainema tapete BLCC-T55]
MKAYEVLKQYANGRRDFRGENLQGQSFRNKDLSGADFSGADIRGANFTNANLKGVNFTDAKAGIQSRSAITLTFALCLLLALPAFLVSYPSTSIRAFLTSSNLADIFAGVVAIVVLEYLLLVTCHEGFRDSTFGELCTILVCILVCIFVVILLFYPPLEELFIALFGAFYFVVIFTVTGLIGIIIFLIINIINSYLYLILYCSLLIVSCLIGGIYSLNIFVIISTICVYSFKADKLPIPYFDGLLSLVLIVLTFFILLIFIEKINELLITSVLFIVCTSFDGYFLGHLPRYIALFLFSISITNSIYEYQQDNSIILKVAINFATKIGTNFGGADLTNADFTQATLDNTNFISKRFGTAILTQTCFHHVKGLDYARVTDTVLAKSSIRRLLVNGKGEHKDYSGDNLKGANLKDTKLSEANLSKADISKATLKGANLEGANLSQVNAIGTDLTNAKLTGACLEEWKIDETTKLNQVDCQYVYLKSNQCERRPTDGEFAPGELIKLFQDNINIVDIAWEDVVNWKAFTYAFNNIKIANEDAQLVIQSIDNQEDSLVNVKIRISHNTDKAKIKGDLLQWYKAGCKKLALQYQERDGVQSSQINLLFDLFSQSLEKQSGGSEKMSEGSNYNFHGPVGNVGDKVLGNQQNNQNITYVSEQKQTLDQAAKEIQKLLDQLESNNPRATDEEKKAYLSASISKPKRERIVSALQAAGREALKESLDNPYFNVALAAIEDWKATK